MPDAMPRASDASSTSFGIYTDRSASGTPTATIPAMCPAG